MFKRKFLAALVLCFIMMLNCFSLNAFAGQAIQDTNTAASNEKVDFSAIAKSCDAATATKYRVISLNWRDVGVKYELYRDGQKICKLTSDQKGHIYYVDEKNNGKVTDVSYTRDKKTNTIHYNDFILCSKQAVNYVIKVTSANGKVNSYASRLVFTPTVTPTAKPR